MKRTSRSTALLVTLLLVGLIIGGVIGQVLGKYVPILAYGESIGISTTTVDLGFLTITFDFNLHMNLAGVLGLILSILVFQRM